MPPIDCRMPLMLMQRLTPMLPLAAMPAFMRAAIIFSLLMLFHFWPALMIADASHYFFDAATP
jgi:hypothetical protein